MKNRTIYARDCLEVLTDKSTLPEESIDLIYLDPPFNSKSTYNLPFKNGYKKDMKPVMAFKDTWSWNEIEQEYLEKLESGGIDGLLLVDIIEVFKRVFKEKPNASISTSAYLVNMAVRLKPMKRVLKRTGSIYLHCDPTASHYLKIIMDTIFGQENFRNEIIWCYRGAGYPKKDFGKKHDIILRYSKTKDYFMDIDAVREGYAEATKNRFAYHIGNIRERKDYGVQELNPLGKHPDDWWEIQPIAPSAKERLGYPTQKPLELLRRIIKSSSKEEDIVLDPFCGCGTTLHAAEELKRQWLGIDISQFATGLVKNRLLTNFLTLNHKNIHVRGCPITITEARELARDDAFEFEKWVCGKMWDIYLL